MASSMTPGSASAAAGASVCPPRTSTLSRVAPPKALCFLVSGSAEASVDAIIDALEVVGSGGVLFCSTTEEYDS